MKSIRGKKLKFKQKRNKENFYWTTRPTELLDWRYTIKFEGNLEEFSFKNETFIAFCDLTKAQIQLNKKATFEESKRACQEHFEGIIKKLTRATK
jgi:hypothetical protein